MGVLARTATSGIYLVHGISRDLQRAARVRAVREGTTLRSVLLKALAEYAAGSWTPMSNLAPPVDQTGPRRRSSGDQEDARCR